MSPIDDYLDMAVHCVENARETRDARYRMILIDMAATWCDLASEFRDGSTSGLERLGEIAKIVAELDGAAPGAPPLDGVEPRMAARLVPLTVH
jgi:hypothetical protein